MKKSAKKGSGQKQSQPRSANKSHGKGRSALSSQTKQKLLDFLTRSAEVERKLEIVKQMLAEEEEFTPASLFHRLDSARKGYIVQRDVDNFLRTQGVELKGSELKTLFGRINEIKSSDRVPLREFQNFILPNQNPKLRYFTVRRSVIIPPSGQALSQKVEWIATKFFNEVIKQYNALSVLNQQLKSSFDFNATNIFKQLSANGQCLTAEDLRAFFEDCGQNISQEQVGCLLRVMDRTGEGQVTQQDFMAHAATLGLKKEHEIFDELSPIPALKPALKGFLENIIRSMPQQRNQTLKDRLADNQSYLEDKEGIEHLLGRSRKSRSPSKLGASRKSRK